MNNKDKKVNVGKDAVVIGDVSGNIGDGSVVIGPTDNQGNVILNHSMAVGRNAHAGPNSIAIGANAGAGFNAVAVFNELEKIIKDTKDPSIIGSFKDLRNELNKSPKDKSKISRLWNIIEKAAALDGFVGLVKQAARVINKII